MGRLKLVKRMSIIIACIAIGSLSGYLARDTDELLYIENVASIDDSIPVPDYDYRHLLRLGYSLQDSLKLIVDNAEDAAKLADIYLSSFMNNNSVRAQRPYHVRKVNNSIWYVMGSAKENKVHVVISGKTGSVLHFANFAPRPGTATRKPQNESRDLSS